MQGWFDIQNYKISILADKKIMIISIGTEKAFGKIQHILMTKKLNKLGIEGKFLSQTMGI